MPTAKQGLFQEIKRRNVFRVGTAYVVFSWLILQVAEIAIPVLRLPESANTLILLILALGFMPALVFAWAFELTPEGIKRQHEVDQDASITAQTGQKLNVAILVALAIVVALVAADRLFPATPIAVATNDASIAVLPFADLSENRDQEYFSDGITEEILNALAQISDLKVAGRTSSFAFKGANVDIREIGETLGVSYVLEGSVRKENAHLRITAQLINVDDGFHVWSDTYDRDLTDIFVIQDEISQAIVSELSGSLLGYESTSVQPPKLLAETYDKYLKARESMSTRTNAGLVSAREVFEEIIAEEPNFARAYASLAETILLLRQDNFSSYGNISPEEARDLVTPLLEKALALDPDLAEAYAVQGLAAYSEKDWAKAEVSLKRAVELNPSLSNAWNWLAITMSSQSRFEESLLYLNKATAIDALWLVPNENLANRYLDIGKDDLALEIVERLRPFHEGESAAFHSLDAQVHLRSGRLAEALLASAKATEMSPNTPNIASNHVLALVMLQEFEQAEDLIPEFLSPIKHYVAEDWEEALPALREQVDDNPVGAFPLDVYLDGANYIGQFERVATYYDTRIQSAYALNEHNLEHLAFRFLPAMVALGRSEDAAALIAVADASLANRLAAGENSGNLHVDQARLSAFRTDYEGTLDQLELALAKGVVIPFWQYIVEFNPLTGNARYAEVRARNLATVNRERNALGWEPVAAVGMVPGTR